MIESPPNFQICGLQHFVVGPVDQDLVEKFFDICPAPECISCPPTHIRLQSATMEEIFVLVGIFPSKSQARKNGISGEIPIGIHLLGSKKKKFFVWKHP